tara:strand:- start:314 stop:478 length:165 start_codon:yes stop_codon:yes gene_type:complete
MFPQQLFFEMLIHLMRVQLNKNRYSRTPGCASCAKATTKADYKEVEQEISNPKN